MKRFILACATCLLLCQPAFADTPGEKFLLLDASLQQVYWEVALETYETTQIIMLGKLNDVRGMTAEQKTDFYSLMRNSNEVLDVECVKNTSRSAAQVTEFVVTFIKEHAEDWDFPVSVQILGALGEGCQRGDLSK